MRFRMSAQRTQQQKVSVRLPLNSVAKGTTLRGDSLCKGIKSMAFDALISAPPFHVQSTAATLKNGFPYFTHHDSVSAIVESEVANSVRTRYLPFY